MESMINLNEKVENKNRKFGSQLNYFPVMIQGRDGRDEPALFTKAQIDVAKARAIKNPEDIPEKKSWLSKIFG